MVICGFCGEDGCVHAYFKFSELKLNKGLDKIHWLFTRQITPDDDIENICAICLHRINMTIDTICDMRKKFITTQYLLKNYENRVESWSEFKSSENVKSLINEEDFQQQLSDETHFYTQQCESMDKIEQMDTVENIDNINWLKDIVLNENLLVIKPEDNSKSSKVKINQRGLPYETESDKFIERESEGQHACKLCGMNFKWRYKALKHVRQEHIQEKPFQCESCDKSFSAADYLNRHRANVHKPSKYICQVCGKEFVRRYKLMDHEKIHSGPPMLKCPHESCTKLFHADSLLKAHISRSHTEKKYVCDECAKFFRTQAALLNHKKTHTKKK